MSSLVALPALPPAESRPQEVRYSRTRLFLGVLGRSWLWFLAGCLLVTLVPIVFGWRPFLVESGSMEPRISVGDVVLASPTDMPAKDLLGHVIVFEDPDFPGRIKTHRAVQLSGDGSLVTKGDANPTNDSMPVPRDNVRGLGRLLVQYVGLPVIWAHTGQWLYLFLFLLSMAVAGWAVNRDREEEERDGPEDGGSSSVEPPTPLPSGGETPTAIAATKPVTLTRSSLRLEWRPLALRVAGLGVLCLALLLPTTAAAFAATTNNKSETWSVPNWDYTTQIKDLGPYLYWKFDETHASNTGGSTASAADSSGNGHPGTYNTNSTTTYFTTSNDGAFITDAPDTAVQLNNAGSCINTTATGPINSPNTVSVVIWFKAASTYTNGGKLAGFENPRTGMATPGTNGGTYDRMLWMDGNGYVWFGVYNGGYFTVRSTTALNNNAWHMAVGTLGSTGTKLYIDGVLQGTSANTGGEATTGFWRAGCGNMAGWGDYWTPATGSNPGTDSSVTVNKPFQASLDEFSVFNSELSASTIQFLYWTR